MKKIIITGATSFLGRNTAEHLIQKGYFVYALIRKNSPNASKLKRCDNLKIVEFDFENLFDCLREIDKADCFINFAWDSSGGRADENVQAKNLGNSLKMLELCKRLGCKMFIFPGSQAEYGSVSGVISESTPCNPVSEYGKVKLMFAKQGLEYARENKIEFIHLRIFSVYGYGDRPNTLVDYCIKSFLNGQNAELGSCLKNWNYLYIEDFADIIEKLIKNNVKTNVINIASRDTRQMREFVCDIHNALAGKGSVSFEKELVNAENSPALNPDISKLVSLVGDLDFTDFTKGICKTVEKYI